MVEIGRIKDGLPMILKRCLEIYLTCVWKGEAFIISF